MQAIDSTSLEADITTFLADLSSAQSEMLALLGEKRELLVKYDSVGLSAMAPREEQLVDRLQSCLERRRELLARANNDGLPHGSVRELTCALPAAQRDPLSAQVRQASSQARILQHNSITNWVLVQRTLIHLSQMLEIIATGGQSQSTYGKGDGATSSGALVDQAA